MMMEVYAGKYPEYKMIIQNEMIQTDLDLFQ